MNSSCSGLVNFKKRRCILKQLAKSVGCVVLFFFGIISPCNLHVTVFITEFNHFNFSASILIEINGLADLATACKNGE
jgi:hypothetical protein